MKIFLDIETIPIGNEPVFTPTPFVFRTPSNYKDPEKIKSHREQNFERMEKEHSEAEKEKYEALLSEWKKGALKATRSQIVCICAVTDDNRSFALAHSDESYLLMMFDNFLHVSTPELWIGHNVSFDLQTLRAHAVKYKLEIIKRLLTFEKWAKNIHDTMQLWAGVRFDDKTKLIEIAEFLGIENLNGDTDGSDIYDLYKAGKFEEIQTKCINDVIMCKQVYERIS